MTPLAALDLPRAGRWVDLTHAFHPGIPHCPAFEPEQRTVIYDHAPREGTRGSGFLAHEYRHVGDIGTDPKTLARLHRRIKETGAESYLEVVSTGRDRALQSARMAADLGVNWLMGGTWPAETLDILDGTDAGYPPFPDTPTGLPTRLSGTPQQVAEHCRHYEQAGCAGVDLLAYRATGATPIELVRAARLVVAGSITTPTRFTN
jgi:alkanesulfonate monooxygenase SsuD/methylene tetrahydromethanopterin reductase-like flavin-dependent oxidoreductase (luciferase family)